MCSCAGVCRWHAGWGGWSLEAPWVAGVCRDSRFRRPATFFTLAPFRAVLCRAWKLQAGFYERGSNVVLIKDKKHFEQQVLNSNFLWVVEFYREG